MTPADWSVIAILLTCSATYKLWNWRDQRREMRDLRQQERAREAAYRRREAMGAPHRRTDPLDDISDEEERSAALLGAIINAAFPADLPERLAAEVAAESDRWAK